MILYFEQVPLSGLYKAKNTRTPILCTEFSDYWGLWGVNVPHYVLRVYERLSCLTGMVLSGTCGRTLCFLSWKLPHEFGYWEGWKYGETEPRTQAGVTVDPHQSCWDLGVYFWGVKLLAAPAVSSRWWAPFKELMGSHRMPQRCLVAHFWGHDCTLWKVLQVNFFGAIPLKII